MVKHLLFKIRLILANSYKRSSIIQKCLGVKFGNEVRITGRVNFGSEPYLITIGNRVTIAQNVTFHTHDGGVWVLRDEYPNINIYGKIIIGNNVFIGSDVIILPNVSIGNNVIVGAGSVVTKSLSSNGVYAGNPAKFIRSVSEYRKKALKKAMFVSTQDKTGLQREILNHLKKRNIKIYDSEVKC